MSILRQRYLQEYLALRHHYRNMYHSVVQHTLHNYQQHTYFYCWHNNFELCNVTNEQSHKFKDGDMVYLIGFNYFKPCKLTLSDCEHLPLEFKVMMDGIGYETFTEYGCYTTDDTEPSIVLATEEIS